MQEVDVAPFLEDCVSVIREAIVEECDPTITVLVRSAGLHFEPVHSHRRERIFGLTGGDATAITVHGERKYFLVPIALGETKLWIAVRLIFAYRAHDLQLDEVTLLFFSGDYTAEKVALLRAEWGKATQGSWPQHAQPHWHVYATDLEFDLLTQPQTQVFGEVTTEEFSARTSRGHVQRSPNQLQLREHFHFAMASRWHEAEPSAHQETLDPTRLLPWLRGCVQYSIGQLHYVYSQ